MIKLEIARMNKNLHENEMFSQPFQEAVRDLRFQLDSWGKHTGIQAELEVASKELNDGIWRGTTVTVVYLRFDNQEDFAQYRLSMTDHRGKFQQSTGVDRPDYQIPVDDPQAPVPGWCFVDWRYVPFTPGDTVLYE